MLPLASLLLVHVLLLLAAVLTIDELVTVINVNVDPTVGSYPWCRVQRWFFKPRLARE